MTSNHQSLVRQICQDTLERPPSERARYLTEACGGDETLRREVEALLAHDVSAEHFLTDPAFDVEAQQIAAADADRRRALIGRTLSHYHIVSQLGAGGMGIVYKDAETTELKRLLDRMLTGQGDIVMIGGEPGVGKTRLAHELLRAHRRARLHVRWFRAMCETHDVDHRSAYEGGFQRVALLNSEQDQITTSRLNSSSI